jgi:NAD(P) transhydrogenase subunit beta
MSANLATVAYIGATILFIMSLGGLSNPETSRRGNLYGMVGMAIAVFATVLGPRVDLTIGLPWIIGALAVGGGIGLYAARKVQMTQMPELVALMHSLVGLAACFVGFASYVDTSIVYEGAEKAIHEVEIYLGILIGAVTFSGSVIAFGKLSGKIGGKPLLLPARHWLNLLGLLVVIWFGAQFVGAEGVDAGMTPLLVMTVIALLFGIHMVMAIGGADMPVVVSMLNSYSGWAAAATGFMLANDLLIVTGALVGSSGAILSFIMCRAMNRNFISVIAGGFGTGGGAAPAPALSASDERRAPQPLDALVPSGRDGPLWGLRRRDHGADASRGLCRRRRRVLAPGTGRNCQRPPAGHRGPFPGLAGRAPPVRPLDAPSARRERRGCGHDPRLRRGPGR